MQRHGVAYTLLHLAYRLINYVVVCLYFEVSVLSAEDSHRSLAADLTGHWAFLSYDQLRFFGRSDPALLLDDEFLDQAIARGDRCYAYIEGNTLGAYA